MIRKKSTRGPSWRQRSPIRPETHQPPRELDAQQTESLMCKVCGRSFHKRDMLKLHLLTHSMTSKPTSSEVGSEEVMKEKQLTEREMVHGSVGRDGEETIKKSSIVTNKEEAVLVEASGSDIVVTRQASSSSKDDEDEDVSEKMYECIACGEEFKNREVRYKHSMEIHGARLKCQCQVCHGKKRSDAASLMEEDHVMDDDEKVRIYRCIVCKSVFFLGCKCLCHIEQNHNSIILKYPYECANCGKMFELASFLNEHQKQEHEHLQKLSRCGYCKDSFKLTTLLDSHIRQLHRITKDPITGYLREGAKPPVADVVSSSSSSPIKQVGTQKKGTIAKKSTSPRPQPPVSFVSSTSSDFGADDLTCEICNYKSHSRAGYNNHMIVYHKVKLDDLPLVSGIGKKMSRKKRKASSVCSDDDSDGNWRPSRVKVSHIPMRSSTRIALAASRRDVDLVHENEKEMVRTTGGTSEVESNSEVSDKPGSEEEEEDDSITSQREDSMQSCSKDFMPSEREDDMVSQREDMPCRREDFMPSGSKDSMPSHREDLMPSQRGDFMPSGREDSMPYHREDLMPSQRGDFMPSGREDSMPSHREDHLEAEAGPSGTHGGDSGEDMDDKCKNCPACKQEAEQAAAAKALIALQAVKREPPREPTRQPQLVIKDVYSLHPSSSRSSSLHSEGNYAIGAGHLVNELPPPPPPQSQHFPQLTPISNLPPASGRNCTNCATSSRCVHCNLLFLDEVMHTIHMGWHGRTNPFDCHACGKQCSDKYNFITHIFKDPHM